MEFLEIANRVKELSDLAARHAPKGICIVDPPKRSCGCLYHRLWREIYALHTQAAAEFGRLYNLRPVRHWDYRRRPYAEGYNGSRMDHPYFYRDPAGNDAVVAHLYSDIASDEHRKDFREWAANNGWTIEFLPEIPSWWNYPTCKVVLYREIREWLPKHHNACCARPACHVRAVHRRAGYRFCPEHKDHLDNLLRDFGGDIHSAIEAMDKA
jgi:hypothetical protein